MKTINLFVYGTLLSQFRGHYFLDGDPICKAEISGNLYHYIAGYPIVELPKYPNLISGSGNPAQDYLEQMKKIECGEFIRLEENGDYNFVSGELNELPYSDNVFEILDRYEGFTPNQRGLYNRSLVSVRKADGSYTWAWVYHMTIIPPHSTEVMSGNWLDCFDKHMNLLEEYAKPF